MRRQWGWGRYQSATHLCKNYSGVICSGWLLWNRWWDLWLLL